MTGPDKSERKQDGFWIFKKKFMSRKHHVSFNQGLLRVSRKPTTFQKCSLPEHSKKWSNSSNVIVMFKATWQQTETINSKRMLHTRTRYMSRKRVLVLFIFFLDLSVLLQRTCLFIVNGSTQFIERSFFSLQAPLTCSLHMLCA